MRTETLIVGGGLCGLHTASELTKRGADFMLVEARDRLGGRILSRTFGGSGDEHDQAGFGLGPAWFWPGQPLMEGLIDDLGLSSQVFTQYASGEGIYEDDQSVRRGFPSISMGGSYRMKGGMQQIIAAIESRVAAERLLCSTPVTKLTRSDESICTTVLIAGTMTEIHSDRVVFAMPPRLVEQAIEFDPPLTSARASELRANATWMAGHAKLLAIYEEPFWRARGLSGDAISHRGPLGEIHDASPDDGGPYALFGFFGVPASYRVAHEEDLRAAAIEQLARLFGSQAGLPLEVIIKDWASDPRTATQLDQNLSNHHAFGTITDMDEPEWDGKVIWSGSETADGHNTRFGGYLEGAVTSSVRTVRLLENAPGRKLSVSARRVW
jgi:monoamine oxidase